MTRILLSAMSARRGGGLTYLRRVVDEFPSGEGHSLTIMSPVPIDGIEPRADVNWVGAPAWTANPVLRFLLGAFYFRFFWPLRHFYDVVYFAGGSIDIPLGSDICKVVAFRNMIPFDEEARRRHPFNLQYIRTILLRHLQAKAFRSADLVIFISQYARSVIDRLVPDRRGQSVVIPHGTRPTSGTLEASVAKRLPDRFILYLSALDFYKAQLELVDAWAMLKDSGRTEKLVLAGPEIEPYASKVRSAVARLNLDEDVILLGNVNHNQVSDLCSRALFNVFMSSCENCPNILLELMAIGTPILVSNYEPMPELGGKELDYVNPYDVHSIAEALTRLIDDPAHRTGVAQAAKERSKIYSWEKTGYETWRAILSCASKPRPR